MLCIVVDIFHQKCRCTYELCIVVDNFHQNAGDILSHNEYLFISYVCLLTWQHVLLESYLYFPFEYTIYRLELHSHGCRFKLFSVSGSRAAEASGQLEAEQRPAIRMQIRSTAENSRSNNRHADKLVMPLLMMNISNFHNRMFDVTSE
jgi:hypothetical protein